MSDKFTVEIITPDKSILKAEVNEVNIPSYEGQMGILKDHIPLITFLRPGLIITQGEKIYIFYVEEGTVEFSDNNLLILTSTARDLTNLRDRLLTPAYLKPFDRLLTIAYKRLIAGRNKETIPLMFS